LINDKYIDGIVTEANVREDILCSLNLAGSGYVLLAVSIFLDIETSCFPRNVFI
jgi:hypothetical protein